MRLASSDPEASARSAGRALRAAPERLAPSPSLAAYVQEIRLLSVDVAGTGACAQRIARLPDGTATLLLRVLGGGRGDLSVAGPRTRALFKTKPAVELALSVKLKPGATRALLGTSGAELRDRIVLLEEVWGGQGARLCDRMLAAPAVADKLQLLERALLERARKVEEPPAVRLARRAARMLAEDASLQIDGLARALGVTGRHLRRAFREHVGVGPKQFARMLRLRRALGGAGSCNTWTEVASSYGYYDQAHFIAEFRDLVGMTPSAFSLHSGQGLGGPASV